MLRIGGIVAFVMSTLAVTLLFAKIHSVELIGVADGFDSGTLRVNAVDRPGLPRPSRREVLFFPASMGSEDDGRPVHIWFDNIAPEAGAIPEGSDVRVSLRQVVFKGALVRTLLRRPVWSFEGIRIASGGRTYSWGTSIGVFYTGLLSASAAPLLLWSVVAAVIRYGRPKGDARP